MITDEERRQIAYRLHEEAENWRDFAKDDTLFDMCDATFVESVLSAFQLNDMDMHVCEAFDKLADLIDRPTCYDAADFDRESFKCSRCGFRVLSIDGAPDAAKLVGTNGGVADFGFCPSCGAMVVEKEE